MKINLAFLQLAIVTTFYSFALQTSELSLQSQPCPNIAWQHKLTTLSAEQLQLLRNFLSVMMEVSKANLAYGYAVSNLNTAAQLVQSIPLGSAATNKNVELAQRNAQQLTALLDLMKKGQQSFAVRDQIIQYLEATDNLALKDPQFLEVLDIIYFHIAEVLSNIPTLNQLIKLQANTEKTYLDHSKNIQLLSEEFKKNRFFNYQKFNTPSLKEICQLQQQHSKHFAHSLRPLIESSIYLLDGLETSFAIYKAYYDNVTTHMHEKNVSPEYFQGLFNESGIIPVEDRKELSSFELDDIINH